MNVYCSDKCVVYLVSSEQDNLFKRKRMSYTVKQHTHTLETAREVTHVILSLALENKSDRG